MDAILLILFAVILVFGLVIFVGAPYVPTLTPQIETAPDLLALKPGQTLLELGCGDGRVLVSIGFKLGGIQPTTSRNGVYLYKYQRVT